MWDAIDIEEVCSSQANRKGVDVDIYLVELCGVESIPAIDDYEHGTDPEDAAHTISADIVLKTGYQWTKWTIRKKDGNYGATQEGDEDAEHVNATFNGYIPRISPLRTYITNQLINTKVLMLVKDRNNVNPRLLGELGNGVSLKVAEQTNDKNGYVLSATVEELDQKPPFYSGAIQLTPTP